MRDARQPSGAPATEAGGGRFLLSAVLVFTMTASSYQIFAFAVLAVDIIEDLTISRTALGLLGSLNTLVGALSAPFTGRFTDRIGPERATVLLLALSAAGMGVMALSTGWAVLAASAVICGVPQGWGNPATNALIVERIPVGARGAITGIKQSGVQFGIFLSGFTLPGLAVAFDWRVALWGYAAVFAVGAVAVHQVIGRSPPDRASSPGDIPAADGIPAPAASGIPAPAASGIPAAAPPVLPTDAAAAATSRRGAAPLPRFIWLLSAFALLYGMVGGTVGRFFPLWANEAVGLSTVVAGVLVALGGLLGIAARIVAGRLTERFDHSRLLRNLAIVGAGYCVALLVTTTVGAWVLWPTIPMYSIGIGAWNAVAMMAIITTVPREVSGRASGVVMLGFLGGLTIGSPLAGLVVDHWGTYQPVWAAGVLLAIASAAIIDPRLRSRLPGAARPQQATTP